MRTIVLAALSSLVILSHSTAEAQYRHAPSGTAMAHAVEIGAHGGYVWTFSRSVYYPLVDGTIDGKFDIGSGGFWGITADFNVRPGTQLELLYNRQDSKVTFQPRLGIKQDIVDVNVEYWHVGALYGVRRGDVMPFGSMTFGATRVDYAGSAYSDTWKFSIIFGLGAKAYVNDRFGVRVQGRLPFTFVDGGFGLGCGTGSGCYTTVGGTGITQIDVSGGAFLMF